MVAASAFAACPLLKVDGARNLSAEELLLTGHFLRAKAMLELAARAKPDDAQTLLALSRAQAGLGDLDAALKSAEALVAAEPNRSDAHVQLASVLGRMAERASMFKQLGLARRAKKELDTALALDPKNLDALYGLMLYSYAAPSFIGGDKLKAQEYAQTMIDVHPARGYLAQARLAKDRKDAAKAEELYRKSVEADAQFYEALTTLASFYLYAALPDYDNAGKYACRALSVDPQRAEAWKILAELTVQSQCWNELDELLVAAEAAVPDDLAPYYSAAVALMKRGSHTPLAEEYLRKYESLPAEANEPSTAYAHYQRGLALEKLARNDEAAVELHNAVDAEPNFELAKEELKRLEKNN